MKIIQALEWNEKRRLVPSGNTFLSLKYNDTLGIVHSYYDHDRKGGDITLELSLPVLLELNEKISTFLETRKNNDNDN